MRLVACRERLVSVLEVLAEPRRFFGGTFNLKMKSIIIRNRLMRRQPSHNKTKPTVRAPWENSVLCFKAKHFGNAASEREMNTIILYTISLIAGQFAPSPLTLPKLHHSVIRLLMDTPDAGTLRKGCDLQFEVVVHGKGNITYS